GFKPSHLFITDIQQAAFAGRFSDTSDLRFIERIVGRIALDDGRRSWQSQRIQTRHTDLDLRQIGAMIFAVAKLEQPAVAYSGIGLTGSRIQAHDFRIQVVNAQQPTTQLSLERLPHGTIPHLRQEVSQSVITEIKRADPFAGQCLQQMETFLRPFLHVRQTVVPARKNEAQPAGNDLSGRQITCPVGGLRKMFIKELDSSHCFQLLPKQRDVIYSLYPYYLNQFLDHSLSLSAQGAF